MIVHFFVSVAIDIRFLEAAVEATSDCMYIITLNTAMLASDMLQSRILTCQPLGRPLDSSARSGGPLCCSELLKDAATMSSFDSFFASALLRFTRSRLQRFKQSSLQLPGKIHTRNHVTIHDVQLQNTKVLSYPHKRSVIIGKSVPQRAYY